MHVLPNLGYNVYTHFKRSSLTEHHYDSEEDLISMKSKTISMKSKTMRKKSIYEIRNRKRKKNEEKREIAEERKMKKKKRTERKKEVSNYYE